MRSEFDRMIVDVLTWRLRVIARQHIEQLAECRRVEQWQGCIERLIRSGYITSVQQSAPIVGLVMPLYQWQPGDSASQSFGSICWKAKRRMTGDRVVFADAIYMATKKAEREFGGCAGRLRQPFQIGHDLGTASVFIAKLKLFGWDDCKQWVSEDVIRRYYRDLKAKKIPDAAFVNKNKFHRVIEFVGRDYSRRSLTQFHNHWKQRKAPYELW